ncbi:unnamed protein product [Phaedon cochleariae]|uniref:Centrosomin N-terminal motif 1 domain-containing protein n=1 Tax=Phaedon cochleariae TaxID=80249 RepID=A0A9N9X813_PHACE|nr:unnamed protein product [Phaedon cochleariae]
MSFFNFGGDFSGAPKRPLNAKSPTIPFCTSPSQLEEVTLDQDVTFSNTMGLRSPGGPMRGRSVREIEDQLSNLKKENFNLKLRIYFLEEKMGAHFTLDKDNIVKKYIELQVEFGNLQKELDEKHDLLCQAVKAMELEEEEHKKYVSSKDDQLSMCQQELEDLRMQLQDTKFDSDGISLKSDTTGFYSNKALNSGGLLTELQEKVKILEAELHLEKENNASLQFIIGHAETLKIRYENTQKECQAKDATISNLHEEIEASNSKIMDYSARLTEMQEKLEKAYKENDSFSKRIRSDSRRLEEAANQIVDLKKKYSTLKTDYEREHKKAEKQKSMSDSRIAELEGDNDKHKAKVRDLQARLEAATADVRKNQNLAVATLYTSTPPPDSHLHSLSVQDPTAPAGAQETHPLDVQITAPEAPRPDSRSSGDFSHVPEAVRGEFVRLREESDALRAKLLKLKKEQFKACEIIKTMMTSRNKANEEISCLRGQVKELERELESVVSKPASDGDDGGAKGGEVEQREKPTTKSDAEEMEIAELYKALTVELEAKVEVLVATLNEKDNQMQNIRKQYDEIMMCLEEKETKLADMEFELLCSENAESSVSGKYEIYQKEMEEKDKKIEKLTEELKKCTCYLQEIVNKELWDKNKEIEKLHNKHSSSPDTCKLQKELLKREEQIEKLGSKISNLQIENERSEKLRAESNEVCLLLNSRLEELALFLDSLLRHKSVLGFLGLHKEKRLRSLVNNSLDISKSFATSMMVSGDQTLAQLSNITALLDGSELGDLSLNQHAEDDSSTTLSIVPNDVTLTYQSHLHKSTKKDNLDNESVILALREQILNLKSELQLRDNELNKLNVITNKTSESETGPKDVSKLFTTPVKCNTTSTTLKYQSECHSESEGWSEPDRVVSRARIGLSQTAPEFLSIAKDLSESTGEESALSLTPTKRSFEKRSSSDFFELQEEIKRKTEELALAEAKLAQSVDKSAFEELKVRLSEAEASLTEARNRKEEAEIKMAELHKTVEELSRDKEVLKESIIGKDKEKNDLINALEVEKGEARRLAEEYEREAIRAKRDIEEQGMKLKEAHKEMESLEASLRSEYEQFAIAKLRSAEEDFLKQLNLREKKAQDNLKLLEDRYAKDYVKRSDVEEKLLQVDKLLAALNELKDEVSTYERTMLEYKERNNELNSKLSELQRQKSQLEVRLSELESNNAELHNRLVRLQASRNEFNYASRGTYTRHDPVAPPTLARPHPPAALEAERRESNASPDLGIESDHGRFSSLEAPVQQRPLLPTIELTEAMSDLLDAEEGSYCGSDHCCRRTTAFAQENGELKRKLLRMRRALEETAAQLNLANQRKKQVEKVICKQIHKTSQVLRKAKANLDSGSEPDLLDRE